MQILETKGPNVSPEFLKRYNALILETFEFTFDEWYEAGNWGEDYISFSVSSNDQMLANLSVFAMELLIEGVPKTVLQIGAVATKEGFRKQGLARLLMEHVLSKYKGHPFLLFAGDSVVDFYPRFGFRPVKEEEPFIACTIENPGTLTRLSPSSPRFTSYLHNRERFSQILDCTNRETIDWFHLVLSQSDNLYEIPEHNTLLSARQKGKELLIYDVIAPAGVSFDDLLPHLHFQDVTHIRFGFNPDWLGVSYSMRPLTLPDNTLFVLGEPLPKTPSIVPLNLRT